MALAHRFEQAGHAEGRVGAQLQRVAEVIIQTAQHRMHAAQAGQGLQVDLGVAHGQVAAFHQRVTELTRQVQVLEITLVETPRGEQHHQRRFTAGRGLARQGVLQGAEETGQVLHAQIAVQLGKSTGDDLPVFQGITRARRRLGTVGGDPPAAIRGTGQVHRIQVQISAAGRLHTLTGPQVVVVAKHQLSRQQPVGQQLLWAIQVGQHGIQ